MGNLSCISCRDLKVRCDRVEPTCQRCATSGRECEYPVRKTKTKTKMRKPPRSSHILGDLEARLARVENALLQRKDLPIIGIVQEVLSDRGFANQREEPEKGVESQLAWDFPAEGLRICQPIEGNPEALLAAYVPAQLQHELYYIYFHQIHPSVPMIHKSRFYRELAQFPIHAALVPLRYAMWSIAASLSSKHEGIAESLYHLARKYAEDLEMKDSGKYMLSPSSAQCWYLLAAYEADGGFFTRACMSVARCVKLVQIMGLDQLDSPYNIESRMRRSKSWIEIEEERRTFWASYFADRWASTVNGKPMSIHDADISTYLPSSEANFESETEELGISLEQANSKQVLPVLSPYAAVIFVTSVLGRCLTQLLPRTRQGLADTNNGEYWKDHRHLDTWISGIFMHLPKHLGLSKSPMDANLVFLHINLHVMLILLHQAAIRMVAKYDLDLNIKEKSFHRCLASAQAIKNIILSIEDLQSLPVSMWIGYCLYISAGVFINDLRFTNLVTTSSTDLGHLLVALKLLSTRHKISTFIFNMLKCDISKAGLWSRVSDEVRRTIGLDAEVTC